MAKTFEELFGEVQQKAATGDPGASRTAELVRLGVHAIGKKVVEEAAEVLDAGDRTRAGGVTERGAREPELHDLLGVGPGVQ